jgi:hypothetical protein
VTLFDDLARVDARRTLTLGLLVEGIPYAFMERPIASSTALTGYTQLTVVTSVQQGDAQLDMEDRREVAATLDVEMIDVDALTLQALFASATRRTTWVTADASDSIFTVDVDDVGVIDSIVSVDGTAPIYIGAETLVVDNVNVLELGVSRGAFGSTARAITGASDDGDAVYIVPPSWRGRRAFLWGFTSDSEALLGVFTVDESPQHAGDRTWRLRMAGVAQEFYERSVGFGIEATSCEWGRVVTTTSGRQRTTFTCQNKKAFRTATAFPTYALLRDTQGNGRIAEIISFDTITGALVVYVDILFGSQRVRPENVVSAQPLGIVTAAGTPAILLYLLLSTTGQAAHVYDRLPGRAGATFDDPGWSIGAQYDTGEIDLDSFTDNDVIAPLQSFIIDSEAKCSDFMREFCLLSNAATVAAIDGKLKLVNLSNTRSSSAVSITGADMHPDSRVEVIADEGTIAPYATIKVGYSPITQEFTSELNLVDTDLVKRYPRAANRKTWEFRSIGCAEARRLGSGDPFIHPADQGLGDQVSGLVKLLRGAGSGQAARRFTIDVTLGLLNLELGDLVILSNMAEAFSELPDMRGASINGLTCRVIGRRPDYDGDRLTLTLQLLDRLLHVCPAAVIDSVSANVLTLSTTTPEVSGASPGDDFYVGASVVVVDVSAENSVVREVIAVTSTTVELDDVPDVPTNGWAIAPGEDYIVLSPVASVAGTTVSGYNVVEMATLAAPDGATSVGEGAHDTEPRWR